MLTIVYFLRLYLKEHLIKIPDDVSVVGYNDLDWCSLVDPPLTVVRVKKYEMGKMATEILFERLQNRSSNTYQEIIFEPELIIRGSVATIKHQRQTVIMLLRPIEVGSL